MNNISKIKKMVGTGVLLALVIVLQLLSNYVAFGPISITLALIPITMGAILYGPLSGLCLGLGMGVMTILAPSTSYFLNFSIFYTILLCLLKAGLAGLVSGLVYLGVLKLNFLKKAKVIVAIILAALVTPIINTGIFLLGATFLFTGLYSNSGNLGEALASVFGAVITLNFLVEFLVSAIISPALVYLTKVLAKQNDLGFQKAIKDNLINKENNNNFDEIDSDKLFS